MGHTLCYGLEFKIALKQKLLDLHNYFLQRLLNSSFNIGVLNFFGGTALLLLQVYRILHSKRKYEMMH